LTGFPACELQNVPISFRFGAANPRARPKSRPKVAKTGQKWPEAVIIHQKLPTYGFWVSDWFTGRPCPNRTDFVQFRSLLEPEIPARALGMMIKGVTSYNIFRQAHFF
jgi:hypothetical protein